MRILIAEDDFVSRKVLEITLRRWHHEAVTVADGEAALQTLISTDAPPLAILDVIMPQMDGLEVCCRVRAAASAKKIAPYIILLTAKSERREIVAGLNAGADDYLIKPYHPNELRARLECGVRIIELQNQLADRVGELESANRKLRAAETELRKLLLTDDLTGLSNRRGFFAFAEQARNQAVRNNQPLLLFYFDIDDLKKINDRHGHEAGSAAIIGVARCLRKTFRASDVLARLGGDEFAVLATNAVGETQNSIIERLQSALAAETESGDHPRLLTVSSGAIGIEAQTDFDLNKHLRDADERMYLDKRRRKTLAR